MNLQGLNSLRWHPRRWHFLVLLWLGWSVAVVICYYRTNITLFRADSGWLQGMAHNMPFPHFAALRYFFTLSHHGHYTPFADYVELESSYLFGVREQFWKWRQLSAVVFLAVCLSLVAYSAARIRGVSPRNGCFMAIGLTSLFVFQPLMRELVAWPLLVLQIMAGSLSALTLFILLQWVREPARKMWIWLAAACSYLSMHLIGYGLATVLATALIFIVALIGIYTDRLPSFVTVRRSLVICLITMLAVACLHAFLMKFLQRPPIVQPEGLPVDTKSILVFVAALFFGAVHDLVSFDLPVSFNNQLPPSMWPWGLLLVLLATSSLVLMARACTRGATPVRLASFVLHCFSTAAFFVLIFMCVARNISEPARSGFHNYLLGPRYVVPANLLLFGSFTVLAVAVVRRMGRAASFGFVLLAFVALIAGTEFGAGQYKQVFSNGAVSHAKAWRAMVALSKQCRAASLPVPNVPMGALTFEFHDWDLKLYAPLLRSSLHLPPQAKIEFEPWDKVCGVERAKYEAAAPALRQVIALLHLQVPPN